MRVALICTDKPGHLEIRKANRDAHLAWLNASGRVELAGPFLDQDGNMTGSMLVIDAADLDDARAWAAEDPYAKAGLFQSVEIREWEEGDRMNYWLFKSEPDTWSWDQQVAKGEEGEEWHGVRNYQARNNMRAMKIGDRGFFYHSNIGKEVVGIVEVCRESNPDSTTDDPRWDCVWIKAVKPLHRAITLDECKVIPGLEQMVLVNNTRLSVQPVRPEEWQIICQLGGVDP